MDFIACYSNFELTNPFVSLKLIVWSLFAGFVAASLLAVYNKRVLGSFVKKLIYDNCLSEGAAMTLTELGFGSDFFIKSALRGDNVLTRFVRRVGGDAANISDAENAAESDGDSKTAKGKRQRRGTRRPEIDFESAKFYIPEEIKYKAEVRYASRGTDFLSLGLCVLIFAVAAFAAIYLIPDLIQFIDNFISELKTGY